MLTILAAMALSQAEPQKHPCESFGEMAQSTMETRQTDTPMSKVLAVVERMAKDPPWLIPMMRDMVKDAYRRPSYYTPEAKAEEVMRFRNDWELVCFERFART